MRRYISLLLFIGLAFWSCEEDADESLPYLDLEWIQYADSSNLVIGGITIDTSIYNYWVPYDSTLVRYDSTLMGYDTIYFDSTIITIWTVDTIWTIDTMQISDTTFVIDTSLVYSTSLFYLNSVTDNVPASTYSNSSKWMHHFIDDSYFEYELTNETEKRSKDVSGFTNILYKEK